MLVSAPIADLMNAVEAVDDASLGTALGTALGTTVEVTSSAPSQGTIEQTVSFVCPKGSWCTAGMVIECTADTCAPPPIEAQPERTHPLSSCPVPHVPCCPLIVCASLCAGADNPLEGQIIGAACLDCPEHSSSPAASTDIAQCVCKTGFISLFDDDGAMSCQCDAGTEIFNGDSCNACAAGAYKPTVGNAKCQDCPFLKGTTAVMGARREAECICQASYWMAVAEDGARSCVLCPPEAVCTTAGVELGASRGGLDA